MSTRKPRFETFFSFVCIILDKQLATKKISIRAKERPVPYLFNEWMEARLSRMQYSYWTNSSTIDYSYTKWHKDEKEIFCN